MYFFENVGACCGDASSACVRPPCPSPTKCPRPSLTDLGDELRRLWEENPVADLPTAAVESATSSPPTLTIAVGNDANDREAGNADSASSTTPGEFRILLSPDVDPPDVDHQRQ